MSEEIKIWEIVEGDKLKVITRSQLNLEERIEKWTEDDISLISDNILVIGRQVETPGGIIDLLCLDQNGDIVIIELKRDKTPREVTAQVLDYASCIKNLSFEDISNIAKNYFNDEKSLEEAFMTKFEGRQLPETLNQNHKMLVVASALDNSTERIIKYLSESYGVSINATSFQFFKSEEGKEYLAAAFLLDPNQVEISSRKISKSTPKLSTDELINLAQEKGCSEIYQRISAWADNFFDTSRLSQNGISYYGKLKQFKTFGAIFGLVLTESDSNNGLYFYLWLGRLAEFAKKDPRKILKYFPPTPETNDNNYYSGYFKNINEADKFLSGMQQD